MSRNAKRTHTSKAAGFTLVELMVTVAIVSILAAIGFPSLNRYILQSRAVEATGFLAEVKARQESYRFDFGMYCNVSGSRNVLFPSTTPGSKLQNWPQTTLGNWALLGAVPSGRASRFVYSTVASVPGTVGGAPPGGATGFDTDRGYTNADFWFITTAIGDLDDDGTVIEIESYSHAAGLWYCQRRTVGSGPCSGIDPD